MDILTRTIDFNSKVSYYLQLRELLVDQIEKNELRQGDKLPSEAELCDALKISRTVVRQAMQELEHEGLIYRRKGKGAFVAEPKINMALTQLRFGFIHDMASRGKRTVTKVLKQGYVPATRKVAQYLHVDVGTSVIEIQRLRFVDNEPIVLVSSYLPANLCAEVVKEDLSKSLYNTLRDVCKIRFAYGERIIESVAANELESRLLDVEAGTPMILVISLSYLADGTAVEYSHAIHRGDRARIEAKVVHYREMGKTMKFENDTHEGYLLTND